MSLDFSAMHTFKYLMPSSPFYIHCLKVFELIYGRRRGEALSYVQGLLSDEVELSQIYQEIFTPLLYEVGYLWEEDRFSVAEEHYVTACIQYLMSCLYSALPSSESNNGRMLGVCVGDELHEIGLRIVSDFFEMEGWDVMYLGSNMPKASFIHSVQSFQPHILCFSYTMDWHYFELKNWMQAAKDALNEPGQFVVGGYGVNLRSSELNAMGVKLYEGDISKVLSDARAFLDSQSI